MKAKFCFVFATIILNVLFIGAAQAAQVKVFLLGGQSNMDGRASELDLPASLQLPQDDVLFYEGSLTTLRPFTQFGPEVTFGRTVADAFPAETFALIKYARGGTSLVDEWDPVTGADYSTFRNRVTNGLAALESAGHTWEIIGMLWTQGERDAKEYRITAQYETDLIEFIADIRSRYGANLPFFLSRLSSGQTNIASTDLANIRQAQTNVGASDPYGWMIDTDGMGLLGDNLHFDAAGQMALGQAFGNTFSANYSFEQDLQLPTVDAGADMITWSGHAVQLDPNVINNDVTDLIYFWSADPADAVIFSDKNAENPTVTITKATTNPSVVTLTLAVNNIGSSNPDVTDIITIDLYNDACLAARLGLNKGADNPTDISGNCVTDIEDLKEVASNWLVDNSLPVQQPVSAPGATPAVPASLLAYYSFDTDFTDGSGNNNDLTKVEVGAATAGISNTDGNFVFGGGALDVVSTTGDQAYLDLASPITMTASDAWSVSFWARRKTGNDTAGRQGTILGDNTNGSKDFIWVVDNPAVLEGVRFRNSTGGSQMDAAVWKDAGDVEPLQYHHWAFVADGVGNMTIYYDNVAQGTKAVVSTFNMKSLASAIGTLHSLNGQIDELYIFNEAIDALTVDALYNDTLLGDGSNPVDACGDMVTWSGQSVNLTPNFVDGYAPSLFTWTANPVDGVVFSDENAQAPTVTITKATDNPSVVVLTLTADDGTGPQSDSLEIHVYDDACQAALGQGAVLDITDFNLDCVTNLEDLAEMIQVWLFDYSLSEPKPRL